MNSLLGQILSVLALLGGLAGITSLFYVRPTRRKLINEAQKAGAEASHVVAAGATILLRPLQTRVQELEEETRRLRQKLLQADQEASELRVALARERESSREEREVSQALIQTLRQQLLEHGHLPRDVENHQSGRDL